MTQPRLPAQTPAINSSNGALPTGFCQTIRRRCSNVPPGCRVRHQAVRTFDAAVDNAFVAAVVGAYPELEQEPQRHCFSSFGLATRRSIPARSEPRYSVYFSRSRGWRDGVPHPHPTTSLRRRSLVNSRCPTFSGLELWTIGVGRRNLPSNRPLQRPGGSVALRAPSRPPLKGSIVRRLARRLIRVCRRRNHHEGRLLKESQAEADRRCRHGGAWSGLARRLFAFVNMLAFPRHYVAEEMHSRASIRELA